MVNLKTFREWISENNLEFAVIDNWVYISDYGDIRLIDDETLVKDLREIKEVNPEYSEFPFTDWEL